MKSFLSIMTLLLLFNAVPISAGELTNKVVIQVSDDDKRTQRIALNNASNLIKHFGADQVKVEIVAYGPGLSLLTEKSDFSSRVESMSSDVTFSACNNTMKFMTKKLGKTPELTDGVKIIPAGVVHIMELQNKGYAYIRP